MLIPSMILEIQVDGPMKRRFLRMFVLLWLGWYLTGPTAEMFDFWDTPLQEMHDIARGAGGMVALIGATIAIIFSQLRRLRDRLRQSFQFVSGLIGIRMAPIWTAFTQMFFFPSHSPPFQLRI